jgi:hypothetical protein
MTPELLLVVAIRLAGSLPVLRWPLAGGLLAILVDLSDLLLFDLLGLWTVVDYQSFDKVMDLAYMVTFLVVALRWAGAERGVAAVLFTFRMAGLVAFEATGERAVLLWFPNVFETWFLLVAALYAAGRRPAWTPARIVVVLAVATAVKLLHEWALHGARVFDGIGPLEFLELVRRALVGG